MGENAPWSPFGATPEEMAHPRALKASQCPSCGFTIHPGDRIATVPRPARGGRKSRRPKTWRHAVCPT